MTVPNEPSPRLPQRVIIYALLCVFVVLLIASIPDRQIHGDDAWLGEQAYWMAKLGHVRSDLFRGLLDYDQRQMVYHKLFILAGAAAVNMFGWSLHSLKAVSLLFYCLFVVSSYFYFTRNRDLFQGQDFYLFNLVMISAPLVFRFAYVFRPEVMLMALGFLSFCLVTACLSRRRDGGSRRPPVLALGAGALAGLGLLTHLNGWIFIAAGSAVLLSRRARTAAAAFAGAAAAVSALYFWDLTSAASVEMFRYQASSDLPIGDAPVWGRLLNIVYEPKRFFYSIREIFPSSLLVLSTIFAWRTLASKYRDLLVYLCVLIVGLAVLSRPRPSYYMVLYMPYIALVITVGIGQLGSLGPAKRAALTSVLAAHFAFSVFYAFTVIRSGSDLPRMNERIASNVPRGATLVAPAGFIFDQVANYRIQSLTLYDRLGDRRGKKLSAPEFFDLARSYGNAYVLVNREFGRKIGLEPPEGQMTIGGYSLVADVEGTLVFRLSQAGS